MKKCATCKLKQPIAVFGGTNECSDCLSKRLQALR